MFFRLMSGLQSSININVANNFYRGDGVWGPNLDKFMWTVGAFPERLKNLYFTYLFTVRAHVPLGQLLYVPFIGLLLSDMRARRRPVHSREGGMCSLAPTYRQETIPTRAVFGTTC